MSDICQLFNIIAIEKEVFKHRPVSLIQFLNKTNFYMILRTITPNTLYVLNVFRYFYRAVSTSASLPTTFPLNVVYIT